MSGGVLMLTFWPAVKDDTKRVAIAAIGLIFLCHLLLASGFVVSIVKHMYNSHSQKKTENWISRPIIAKCRSKVLQNAPKGAFCNTSDLH